MARFESMKKPAEWTGRD